MASNDIVRQLYDIQNQADKLISGHADLDQIANFAKYNLEMKSFLLQHVGDDFILGFIQEIPEFEESSTVEVGRSLLSIITYFIVGWLVLIWKEKREIADKLETVRDIKGKYATITPMLTNYLRHK